MEEISINSLKRQEFTAEYLFAEEIVKAAVGLRTVQKSFALKIELGYNVMTKTWRKKIKYFFSKEGHRLDEHVRRHICRHGQSDYSNRTFLSCVLPFIEEYKNDCESEEEFLLICSKISYVAAYFLKENIRADVIDVAVDHVYKILLDTFYPSVLIKGQWLEKDISDRKYRFAYTLTKNLVELKGIPVPELELPNSDNFMFTSKHKEKIKDLFTYEWAVLDKTVKGFAIKEGTNGFGDDSLEQCMDNIGKEYGWVQNTDEKLLQVSARVAYVAAAFPIENRANAMQLAVDRIHQMIKLKSEYKKYKNDENYRFSCDLIHEVLKMRSNPLSFADNSFSIIAHRNKIEHLLNGEKSELDTAMRLVINDSEGSESGVRKFFNLWKQVKIDKKDYRSTEQTVLFFTRIAYLAACFSRNNSRSNAPELALEFMLKIIKDMSFFSNSKEALNMHTSDKHYRFAFGLVNAILEIMSVPVSDKNLIDSCNITKAQMKKIRKVFLKESSQLEKSMEKLTDKFGVLDYNDGKFIQLMFHFLNDSQWYRTTEKEFIHVCLKIAYMSAFFSEKNINSNAPILAANRIYEMAKEKSYFRSFNGHQVLIAKTRDKHYRFAYDVVRTVLEIKEIPLSTLYLSDPGDILFTDKHKNKIKMLHFNERFLLDEILGKLDNSLGHLDYSDDKFLRCMDEIVEDYDCDKYTEEELLKNCSRIAYMAAGFLEKNRNSNATLLAVNYIYGMSKKTYFSKRMEGDRVEEHDFQFAYDLVKAAFEIRTNPSFKMETIHPVESWFMNSQINEIQKFLAKEWPRLHELVRKITERNDSSDFRDEQFLECMHQIISNHSSEQKSEGELIFVFYRIAYVAIYFQRENIDSSALELATEQIYQMRKKFCQFSNTTNLRERDNVDIMKEKIFFGDVQDKKYRFAYDLVGAVMELQNTPVPDEEFPDPEKIIFTPQHRTKIKKLFRKQSTKIEQLIENLTNVEGNFDYSDSNFLHCMDTIFKSYEDELATKNRFVRLCARMAYPVSFFIRKNITSNARILAIERIHDMVKKSNHFNKDMEEEEKLNAKVKCDKYRFAYDLVNAVAEIRGQLLLDIELPESKTFPFTEEHRRIVEKILLKQNSELDDLINKFTCNNETVDYSEQNFKECMDQVIIEYGDEKYTIEHFVGLCAKIAYVAVCYYEKTFQSHTTKLAVNEIHEMSVHFFGRRFPIQTSW